MSSEYTAQRVARSDLDDRLQAQKSIADVLAKECADVRQRATKAERMCSGLLRLRGTRNRLLKFADDCRIYCEQQLEAVNGLEAEKRELKARTDRAEAAAKDTFEYETQMAEYKARAEKAEAERDTLKAQLAVNPHVYGKIRIAELEAELAKARKALVELFDSTASMRMDISSMNGWKIMSEKSAFKRQKAAMEATELIIRPEIAARKAQEGGAK
jgi:hypothetical protein